MIGFISCNKTETDFTGNLSINIHNTSGANINYSYITISIFINDMNGALIGSGQPDNNGNFKMNLLYGNYYVQGILNDPATYQYDIDETYVQIKGSGKTTNITFNF